MQHSQDRSGEQVGDYRLLRRLGAGSFGEVYLAEERRAHRQVALKLLKTPLTGRDDLKAFLNEVRSFRLVHAHIVPLLDIGMSEQDLPFLVMEYVDGGTLRDRYPKGSKVPLEVVVDLTSQLASALQYAHDQHLVHRDVKPENMLCRADGTVLLSDFGIASVAPSTSSVSLYQGAGGTPLYMAPEQIEGKPQRGSDQYALAVVVYEWLASARPFQGTLPELISQHLHTPPPSLLDQVPTLPAAVEQVVFKALSKQPQERFARVDDFAVALHAASHLADAPSSTMRPAPSVPSVSLPSEREAVRPPTSFLPAPPSLPTALLAQGSVPRAPIISPRVAIPPQDSATLPPPLTPAQPARRRSPAVIAVLILMTVILLGGGSIGIYGAVTSNWPWNPSSGQSTPTSSGTTAQATSRMWHAQRSGTSQALWGVAWSGSQFVAVGWAGTILTSPDGRTWTIQHAGTSNDLSDVIWSGSQFVAVGSSSRDSLSTILTSPDGKIWRAHTAPNYYYLDAVTWSGSQFVAVGRGGFILTSPDGRTWTIQHADTSNNLWGITWSGSQFVAMGDQGLILTSPDGRTWTIQHADTSNNLHDITWSGSQFVAVGDQGLILTSPDGRTWTALQAHTANNLYGVAWSGSQFVAVGDDTSGGGMILTSPNGRTWTALHFGTPQTLAGVAWSGSQFVAVGQGGTILTSP